MDKKDSSSVVRALIRTNRMHRELIERSVSTMGIHHTQHRILMYLSKSEKIPSQKELAEHLCVTPAAVTLALKKIEKDGYIKKKLGKDNRYYELEITEKGRELVLLTQKVFGDVDSRMLSGISKDDLLVFERCLSKMQSNLSESLGSTEK